MDCLFGPKKMSDPKESQRSIEVDVTVDGCFEK